MLHEWEVGVIKVEGDIKEVRNNLLVFKVLVIINYNTT